MIDIEMFKTANASDIKEIIKVEETRKLPPRYPKVIYTGDVDENTCEQIYEDGTKCVLKKSSICNRYIIVDKKKLTHEEFLEKIDEIKKDFNICIDDEYVYFK